MPGVEQREFEGGRHVYRPLGDDAVIRFHLTAGDWIEVRLEGEKLDIHHQSEAGNRIAVTPEMSNVIKVVLVPKESRGEGRVRRVADQGGAGRP